MSETNVTTYTSDTGLTPDAGDRSDVVRQFFGRWGLSKAAAMASFDEFFTPDTVWENVGLATTVGIDAARAFAENIPPGFETMIAEIKIIAEQGRFVFTERVDDFYNSAGKLLVSARGIGVAEVDGGRILNMREYFIAAEDTSAASAPATEPV